MITDEEFLRIFTFIKQRYGIDLGQKKTILNGRLENYLKLGGWKNFNEMMDAMEKDESGRIENEVVNHLTTNYTYFMREFQQFDFFKKTVLPWAEQKAKRSRDLRIWCGAASTGEEPYMIAMVLRDYFGLKHGNWDTRVLATDLSTKVLRQAMAGVYQEEQLKDMPEQWKRHFFKKTAEGTFRVTNEIKQEVIFRQFNLMSPFPFRKKMHTVFLRNVMIYFDERTKLELLRKVYDCLEPGGYLFIGMTETLDRDRTLFEIVQPSIFRKREGS